MLTLETERLVLRDFVLADWDALNTILSDPLVTRYMHFASWDENRRRTWLAQIVQEAQNPHRVVCKQDLQYLRLYYHAPSL